MVCIINDLMLKGAEVSQYNMLQGVVCSYCALESVIKCAADALRCVLFLPFLYLIFFFFNRLLQVSV